MSTGDKADSLEELAPPSVVSSTSFTSSDVDDEGFGTTSYSASASDVESTASSRTVTEVRHKRYVVTSTAARLPSVTVDPGPEPSDAPTADIVALNARFMYYVDRVRFLELENKTLRHNVTELEIKSVSPEMYKTFQLEIDRGRQKVADLSAQRSQLQVEVQKMEREMREVNHKVFEESRSRKEALRELEKLRTELYDTKKAYKDAQDNLRLKAQEQEFKTRTHEQEVKEVRKEVLNISIELEKLRNENTKLEIGVLGATGELHQFIQGGEGNAQLQAEVAEISHNSSTEVTQYVSMLEQREVELESLHHSLEEQRREYEKLMHMKLDLELALKHHGLEFTTIQYDVHDWSPSDRKSSTPKGTPIRRRPLHEMSHSNKKLKTDHHSSVDGSFLSNEAASISAGGGSPSSLAGNASGTGGQTGYIITENYTFDETSSQQQTRQGQVVGGGGGSQLVLTEAHTVDDPGPTDPKRVLTPSGEYVAASATKTVRRSGETVDTTMGDDSVYGLRAEGTSSNHDTSTEVQPGSSGPRRVLTASGEYIVVTSSSGDQTTTTTATAEGQPGLSGQKSVLTSSGEYVVVTSSSEDQTTTTGRAEDHPGLPGTKRVLTASGEYVVETSSSEYQTSTTTKGGVGSGQVNVGAGTYSGSTGSSRRMDEATSTVRKRTDYIEGVETSFSSHQETQTDQDEIDASAKSGGWRFFGRQSTSTTSSTSKHSSQSVQHQLQAHHASGMQQMGSNFWGKSVRRETTRTADRRGGLLWGIISWPFSRAVKGQQDGLDETDATTVSTTTTTTSGSTTGRKATSEGLHLADGTKRSSRSCLPLIGRLCVWLLPLLFLLLLLFFLLSSLLPGGMMGMFLGWERGSCHLQNSFRQSWRLMLRHKNPPPI